MNKKLKILIIIYIFSVHYLYPDIDIIRDYDLLEINDSENNKYLGHFDNWDYDIDPEDTKWISRIFIYEKFIVYQINWGFDVVGYTIYNRNDNINIMNYETQDKIFETYEYSFMGFYDNYLFLLRMGNSPIFRDFIILDIKTGELIFEGIHVFRLGLKIFASYEMLIYEDAGDVEYTYYEGEKYTFNIFTFNLKTGEKEKLAHQVLFFGILSSYYDIESLY